MAYVLVDDNGDPGMDGEAARLCAESFIRRPSVNQTAMRTIFGFMNNVVLARRRPESDFCYNAAAFFVFKNEASWVVSGDARALLFVGGKPARASGAKRQPFLGSSPAYRAEPEGPFPMEAGETALLLCAGAGAGQVDPEEIAGMLGEAGTPAEWMERIAQRYGEELNSALTAFLPPPRKRIFGLRKR